MGQMVIGTTELKNKIEELRALNTQFKSAVSELENTEGALNGMWEGDAKNTFHNAFMSDKQQMDNFYSTIELYAQKLDVNHKQLGDRNGKGKAYQRHTI